MRITNIPTTSTPIHANSLIVLSPNVIGMYGVRIGIFLIAIKIIAVAINIIAPRMSNNETVYNELFLLKVPGIMNNAAANNTMYIIDSDSSMILLSNKNK